MPQFSLLVSYNNPIPRQLYGLISSLEAQTNQDWELILVVQHGDLDGYVDAVGYENAHPQVRAVIRPANELLAWSCNQMLPELGSWIVLLDQHDHLPATALATMAAAAATNPEAKVIYSDECLRSRWGRKSFRHLKAAFDPHRLRHQEYLGGLTIIQKAWLEAAGGFSPLASDVPAHDLYLRTSDALGRQAFHHVPEILLERYRDYLRPQRADVRLQPHMVRYDLHGIQQHLERAKITAQVEQVHGTVEIAYKHRDAVSVAIYLLVSDDLEEGDARIRALNHTVRYRPSMVHVLHRGMNQEASRAYQQLVKDFGYRYEQVAGPMPAILNQKLSREDSAWALVLDALPVGRDWLEHLMGHARLNGVAAIGGRVSMPRRLEMPGTIGYWYTSWDWNTRGRFNHLQVTHQVGALGSACLLVDVRKTRAAGGFAEELPTLYAMDLTIRLDAAGHDIIYVPEGHVLGTDSADVTEPEEVTQLELNHPGWVDRFRLHIQA